MNVLTQSQVAAYHEKGYLFPLPALSPEELKEIRRLVNEQSRK